MLNKLNKSNKFGIYFHIPFCIKKCLYCNFYSICDYKTADLNKYIEMIINEVNNSEVYKLNKNRVTSIYFGGGTPSILNPRDIKRILRCLDIDEKLKNIEITLEVNPETVDFNKLIKYKKIGINRLSFGAQTFHNKKLISLGRIHTKEKSISIIKEAKKIGFSFNIDIIFGYEGDSVSSVILDLKRVVQLGANHISFYSLELSKNSTLKPVSEKLNRDIYHKCTTFLKQNGFFQYEISNFCQLDFESKHNMNYFDFGEYLGFGAGAHSFYFLNNKYYRMENKKLNKNLEYKNVIKLLNKDDLIKEYIIFKLRKNKGLLLSEFKERFGVDFLEIFEKENNINLKNKLISISSKSIKLTKKGFDLYNTAVALYM